MIRIVFYYLLLLTVVLVAFRRGDKETRLAAVICLFASLLSAALIRDDDSLEAGIALVDLAVLASFVAIALRSHRFWPLWVSGLQLTTSISHLLFLLQPTLLDLAYHAAMRFWSYPILFIVIAAALRSRHYSALEPSRT
jgi:peptidoglycan/LPS O-acetylase OafA/YrhL